MTLLLALACAPEMLPADGLTLADIEAIPEEDRHPSRVIVWSGEDAGGIEVISSADPVADIASFHALGVYAEPDLRRHTYGSGLDTVEDPFRSLQWHLDVVATDGGGDGAIVAVIDTGVSGGGSDGFDRLLSGYDFVDEDDDASDENGHGTHVAGTIAQATGNGVGVGGVAPGASIVPIRVLDEDGSGWTSDTIRGIDYAREQGVDVINLSLGSSSRSWVEAKVIESATAEGIYVVAAAGNDGGRRTGFPAAYEHTVAVSSTDAEDVLTDYSNVGRIELAAPGGDLYADVNGDGYGDGVLQETLVDGEWGYWFYQGTSMATPHVAGAAAVLMAEGATAEEARRILNQTAEPVGPRGAYGHGRVDLEAATRALADGYVPMPGDPG